MNLDRLLGTLGTWEWALNLVTIVLLPIELVWLRRTGRWGRQRRREMIASGVQFLPVIATSALWTAAWLVVLRATETLVPWEIPLTWWSVALVLVGADFLYYWEHRSGHRVNAFWSLYHSVHHSSPVYDQSTAFRLSVADGTVSSLFLVPLVLAGFPAALAAAALAVVVGYQTWIHTETVRRLPAPFEWLLNTASHHRVHHGTNPEYIDKNYGGILIVWDRLFGTFEPERAQVTYGLTTQIGTTRWRDVQVFELRRLMTAVRAATNWSDRLALLVRPPGWTPATSPDRHATRELAGADAGLGGSAGRGAA